MHSSVLTTIAISGFGIALFHAAIPTHWLPFVLTSRVQGWSRGKTILLTAIAGSGHVLMTALLGLGITGLGAAVSETIGNWFPRIAGGALLLFGLYYIVRQIRGKGHVHFGYPHEHLHEHDEPHTYEPKRTSDRAAMLSLLAFLTFSPCEGFLPFYVSGIRYGWAGFAMLTAVLSVATVAGMVLFTTITIAGLGKVKLGILEKYESALTGAVLCVVGILIMIVER